MRFAPILILAVLLAACGDQARTAGGVSKSEADALDDAAAMTEEQRLPADAGAAPQASTEPVEQ